MADLGDYIRTLAYAISVLDMKVSLICNWRFLLNIASVIRNICSPVFLYVCSETVHVIMQISFSLIFIIRGVGLGPLGMPVTSGPIVSAPDERWVWSIRGNENWQKKMWVLRENMLQSAVNSIRPCLGWSPGRGGGKPATDRLSCCSAPFSIQDKKKIQTPCIKRDSKS
jgi:hypothetical protein